MRDRVKGDLDTTRTIEKRSKDEVSEIKPDCVRVSPYSYSNLSF